MSILISQILQKSAPGTRPFLSVEQVKQFIVNSKNYKRDNTDPLSAGALLLLSTRRQQTWLIATPNRLYCILDDERKPEPHINWSMPRHRLVEDGGLAIQLEARDRTDDRLGLVDIGAQHRSWLYSRSLFRDRSVEKAIEELIFSKMNSAAAA